MRNSFAHSPSLLFINKIISSQIKYTDDQTYRQLEKRIIALTVQGADLQSEFLLKKHEADLPFVIQTKEGAAYIGILNVVQHSELLAEVLEKYLPSSDAADHKVLKAWEHQSCHVTKRSCLSLDNTYPLGISRYLIAVTPVWIDRTTGDEVTLSDRPKLVSVLKQLQE